MEWGVGCLKQLSPVRWCWGKATEAEFPKWIYWIYSFLRDGLVWWSLRVPQGVGGWRLCGEGLTNGSSKPSCLLQPQEFHFFLLRYNLHDIKHRNLKDKAWWVFIHVYICVATTQIKIKNTFCTPGQALCCPLPVSILPRGNHLLDLACFWTSCKWNYKVYPLLCLASFAQNYIWEIHPRFCG